MKSTFYSYLLVYSVFTLAWGEEFQVNTRISGAQANADIAMDARGNFVVVWNSYNQDGHSNGIFAQRFDPNCIPVGEEFQINTTTDGNQKEPSVAMNAVGNFVVAWQGPGLDREDIFAQQFDPNGLHVGDELLVNSYTESRQRFPRIATNDTGVFAVVWESDDILTDGVTTICSQLFDELGFAIGPEFIVNEDMSNCADPDIAMDESGGFIVVWMQGRYMKYSIMAKLYNPEGTPQTSTLQINTTDVRSVTKPSVAMNQIGQFVITWDNHPDAADLDDVQARIYEPDGTPIGEEFRVNTSLTGKQYEPKIAVNSWMEFVIVWNSEVDPDSNIRDIFGQRYDGLGQPIGEEFLVNTYTNGDQRDPAVAIREDGNFVTVWQSDDQDGSGWGIFGRMEQTVSTEDSNDNGIVDF